MANLVTDQLEIKKLVEGGGLGGLGGGPVNLGGAAAALGGGLIIALAAKTGIELFGQAPPYATPAQAPKLLDPAKAPFDVPAVVTAGLSPTAVAIGLQDDWVIPPDGWYRPQPGMAPIPIVAPKPGVGPPPVITPPVTPPAVAPPLPGTITIPGELPIKGIITPAQFYTYYPEYQRYLTQQGIADLAQILSPLAMQSPSEELKRVQETLQTGLTALTSGLTSELDKVAQQLAPAVAQAIGAPVAALQAQQAALTASVEAFSTAVRAEIASQREAITTALSGALEGIRAAMPAIVQPIATAMGALEAGLTTELTEIQATLGRTLGTIASAETDIGRFFTALVAQPEQVIGPIGEALKKHGVSWENIWQNALPLAIATGITAVATQSQPPEQLRAVIAPMIDRCTGATELALGAGVAGVALGAIGGAGIGGEINLEVIVASVLHHIIRLAIDAALAPNAKASEYDAWRACPVQLPSVEAAATANRLGLLPEPAFLDIARAQGLDEPHARIIRQNQKTLPTADQLLDMMFRLEYGGQDIQRGMEVIKPWLEKLGYDESGQFVVANTALFIPPITDVLHFMLRDVFFPEYVETYGMDSFFPDQMLEFTRKQGITDDLAHKYWQAHWILPSITQIYEMWWKGIIDEKDVDRVIRAWGHEPYWWPKLKSNAYHPLNRIDIRRMFALGVFKDSANWKVRQGVGDVPDLVADSEDDAVVKHYQLLGYSEADSKLQLSFAKHAAEQQALTQSGVQRRTIATQVISALKKGAFSEEQARLVLSEIGFNPDTVQLDLAAARIEERIADMETVESEVRSGFVSDAFDKATATRFLSDYGFAQDVIDRRLAIWEVARLAREERGRVPRHRELTLAEVTTAYKEGLIDVPHAKNLLLRIGLDDSEIATILAIAEHQETARRLSAAIKGIRTAFISTDMDPQSAQAALGAMGIGAATIKAYITEWQEELETGEIKRLRADFDKGAITAAQARAALIIVGVLAADAARITDYWERLTAARTS